MNTILIVRSNETNEVLSSHLDNYDWPPTQLLCGFESRSEQLSRYYAKRSGCRIAPSPSRQPPINELLYWAPSWADQILILSSETYFGEVPWEVSTLLFKCLKENVEVQTIPINP